MVNMGLGELKDESLQKKKNILKQKLQLNISNSIVKHRNQRQKTEKTNKYEMYSVQAFIQ